MSPSALIFMLCSWGVTLGILTFCFIKLLKNKDKSALTPENERDNTK